MTKKDIKQKDESAKHRMLPRPSEIKNYLDQHVVGQDKAKKILSSVNLKKGTFTLQIRSGDDTSKRKQILETWNNLSLDPNANNFTLFLAHKRFIL